MSATTTPRLIVEGKLGDDGAVVTAAEEALLFLADHAAAAGLPAAVRWRYVGGGAMIELAMSDDPEGRAFEAHRNFWPRWMKDPAARNICHLKVWGDLLAKRTEKTAQRVDELIRKYQQEQGDADEAAD